MKQVKYTWKDNDFTNIAVVASADPVLVTKLRMTSVGLGENWKNNIINNTNSGPIGFWTSHGCYLELVDSQGRHYEPWGFSSMTIRADEMAIPYNANTNPNRDHELEFSFPYPFVVPGGFTLNVKVVQNNRGNSLIPAPGDVISLDANYYDLPKDDPITSISGDIVVAKSFRGYHKGTVGAPEVGEYTDELLYTADTGACNVLSVAISYPIQDGMSDHSSYWPRIQLVVETPEGNSYPIGPGEVDPHKGGKNKTNPAYYKILTDPFSLDLDNKLYVRIPVFKFSGVGGSYIAEDYIRVVVHATPI